MMDWLVDLQARTARNRTLGLVVRFTPDPAEPGAWDGEADPAGLDLKLAPDLPRLMREAGDAFRAALHAARPAR